MISAILGVLVDTVKGVISGAIASTIGYAKQDKPENWDLGKFTKTVVIGMVASGLVRGSRMPIPELASKISEWLATEAIAFVPAVMIETAILTGIVIVADQVMKVVVRRTDIVKVWNKFKTFLGKYWDRADNALLNEQ